MQTLSLMKLKKKHQEGTCSFPICCSEAIEVTSPTNLKDANPKMLGTLQDDLKNSKKSSNSTSHTLQWGNHQMRVLDVTEPCAAATFPSRLDFWRCSHDLTRPGGFLGMAGIQTATYSIIDPPLVGSTMGGIKTFPGFPMVPTGPTSKRHVFFSCQKTKNASSTTHLPEALHHIATCFFLHRALKKNEQLFSRNDT